MSRLQAKLANGKSIVTEDEEKQQLAESEEAKTALKLTDKYLQRAEEQVYVSPSHHASFQYSTAIAIATHSYLGSKCTSAEVERHPRIPLSRPLVLSNIVELLKLTRTAK